MPFADTYFRRFQSEKAIIGSKPSEDLFLSIVIPVHNEPELRVSLQSLVDCDKPEKDVEIIVVINSSEKDPTDIKEVNRNTCQETLEFAKKLTHDHIRIHVLNAEDLPSKFAGVGLARKIGMDEALHRFNLLDRPKGIIAGFDADSLVEKNYLNAVLSYFVKHPKSDACSILFEHPTEGTDHDPLIYDSIIKYELHLRYFIEALRFAEFPFAYHTIGSSFAVRADVYASEGGMNRKKAGEDFYFLQKIIQRGHYGELNSTCVIPSPRVSDRVPFGTGAAIGNMFNQGENEFYTYTLEVFEVLKLFFSSADDLRHSFNEKSFPDVITEFLKKNDFKNDLIKIRNNSPNPKIFRKRFFDWFNAFRVIKFVNFAHEGFYKKTRVGTESEKLLKLIRPAKSTEVSEKELLILYRQIQKGLL
jgi:glycosyltransferase involved in cell wall biosynthesis